MSERQKRRAETWQRRVELRLADADGESGRAVVWWDEFRRRADDLPAGEREAVYRTLGSTIREQALSITQGGVHRSVHIESSHR